MNLTDLRPPAMGVSRNPLLPMRPGDMKAVDIGVPLRDLAPEPGGLLVCRYNGEWLLREHWSEITKPGDVIEWYDVPRGGDFFKSLLRLALMVAGAFFFGPAGAIAGWNLGNALLPFSGRPVRPLGPAGAVYNASLNGNEARIDQPIWKICGRRKITPPFAGKPYVEFSDNDLYYYAVVAVGVGNHTLERAFIGKTPIGNFYDVLVAQYLAPGVQPSRAKVNVSTSTEVANLELLSGKYVGGYVSSRPKDRPEFIGIDIVATRGLGMIDSGDALTVTWRVEKRTIDDYGYATGSWTPLANESKTDSTSTPQQWSFKYAVDPTERLEIRVVRTDIKNTSVTALHDIEWRGLRAYLKVEGTPLDPNTAHYEVVMRASQQLSSLSYRDLALIVIGHARTWNPTTGWGPEVETRNPAWWLADLWTSPTWGEKLPDDRVDLQGLYDLSLLWDERQDRCDITFDQAMPATNAAQLIARTGRARAFQRYGIRTVARDGLVELPSTAFTPRNTQPKSMGIGGKMPTKDTADGVILEYTSGITWEIDSIECPCPGFTVTDTADSRYDPSLPMMSNPVHVRLDGIIGATHAEREGLYEAADRMYRQRTVRCTTEMQGMLTDYMAAVRWQPEIAGYGQSGDVAFWDSGTLVMGLTEKPQFGESPLYLTLIRDDGTLTTPVAVLSGPTEWDITLPAAPDFTMVLDDGSRERPKFILGPLDTCDELVKISAITDGGKTKEGAQLYKVTAVVDDARVHGVDNHLLPTGDEVQDPPLDGTEDGGGGDLVLVDINGASIGGGSNLTITGTYTLKNDGTIHSDLTISGPDGDAVADFSGMFTHQWMRFGPVDPAVAALFDVRFTLVSSVNAGVYGGYLTGTFDTWLSLSDDRTITVVRPTYSDSYELYDIRVEIREHASGILQDTANVVATVSYSTPP